ncbi:MFS transporter [Petrotoga sp. 9PWA.NaAc.5.4]|uniref:MFS transporter n=1 Tax=Petrotoga sp. 9PWA.NaAc.5.4 TaxID=1434328 RepID=UPI000CC087B4|nr:MFS transporter [Petrotoga sp. 9PWA.NaAc.5.4]PNR96988.1 arabinose ABC transporter permease [Petrotoga sp. 9PWA.NaAc.5.4]
MIKLPSKVISLLIFSSISSSFWAIYKVVFNLFLGDIGYTNQFIGQVTSVEMLGSAILGIIIGILGDKIGKKKMLLISSMGFGILILIRSIFPYKFILLFLGFISGGVMSSRTLLLNSYIIDITDHSIRGTAFGYNFAIFMGSGVLGNFVGGYMGEYFGLKATLYITGICYAVSPIFLRKISESTGDKNISFKKVFDFSEYNKDERYIIKFYLLRTIAVAFGAGLFVNFGSVIYRDLFDMSPSLIGISLSIAQFGAAVGSALSPILSKRFGPFKYTFILNSLVIPLIIGLGFIRIPLLFIVLYALRFTFMNMTTPVETSSVLSSLPKSRITSINSLKNAANFLTRSLAATIFGVVSMLPQGYTYLFLISSVFYAIALFFMHKLFIPLKKSGILNKLYKNNS